MSNGYFEYMHMSKLATLDQRVLKDPSFSVAHAQSWENHYRFAGFSFWHSIFDTERSTYEAFSFGMPLWPWLLLLLIAPVRWLRAQPANISAFPVVTNDSDERIMCIPMQRRIRTQRLSIVATASLAALLALSLAGVRSFWRWDAFYLPAGHKLLISHGYFQYSHTWISQAPGYPLKERSLSYESGLDPMEPGSLGTRFLGFYCFHIKASQTSNCLDLFELWIPIWFPLLLLLTAPAGWLIARRANWPAFAIIAGTTPV